VNGPLDRILVIQTAFIGDVILTLPLMQVLKKKYPAAGIDIVAVPRAAEIFANHPAVSRIIVYDKRGSEKGIGGFLRIRRQLLEKPYDLVLVPHRSLRSALLARSVRATLRIGFDRSAGRWLFDRVVRYDAAAHEIDRNLSLLAPLDATVPNGELPRLYPSEADRCVVDDAIIAMGLPPEPNLIAVAPGSIWNTKRWPADRYAALCRLVSKDYNAVVLIGGKDDTALCRDIRAAAGAGNIVNTAGMFSLLQSAEIIRRCRAIVTNDSAPLHLAVAVGTPVAAIFGATVPGFGFGPRGERDVVIETNGLKCRPCAIHGGEKCPIGTFECMKSITPERVVEAVKNIQ